MPDLFKNDDFGVVVFGYGSEVDSLEPIVHIDSKEVRADGNRTKQDDSTISSNVSHPNFPTWLLPEAAGRSRMCSGSLSNPGSSSMPISMGVAESRTGGLSEPETTGEGGGAFAGVNAWSMKTIAAMRWNRFLLIGVWRSGKVLGAGAADRNAGLATILLGSWPKAP